VQAGVAYVVVQHLSPDHESALPELLARITRMPVAQASQALVLQPDHVYTVPPNCSMTVAGGRLHLKPAPPGLRLPVDAFLRSLAQDAGNRAVGVILSGMGSDGVFGLAAIQANNGLTVVQDPATAQADGMPGSAIQAGVADLIEAPAAMPARIVDWLEHRARTCPADTTAQATAPALGALQHILAQLLLRSGHDFSHYKANTLVRRIERRMAVHQLASMDDYAQQLRNNPAETQLLFKELLIGVTSFFRDPAVWAALGEQVIPALVAAHPGGKVLRAWVAGCSTGEEAYTLAMVFREAVDRLKCSARFTLQIFATDLDPDAIDAARKGHFLDNIAVDVSPERLAAFFQPAESGGWQIAKDIREMVVFATQNVTTDPPFTKLDLLCCRNLLIYFDAALQQRVMPVFQYAVNPGGWLLLGNAETVGALEHAFAPSLPQTRLYQRLDTVQRSTGLTHLIPPDLGVPALPAASPVAPAEDGDDLGLLTDQLIQQTWAPPAVLVNAQGDILYISGRTGKYLEPAAGKTNMNVHAMARAGLREALTSALHRALHQAEALRVPGLRVGSNGGTQYLDLVVQALDQPKALRGRLLVLFVDRPAPAARRRSSGSVDASLHQSLQTELQSTREALQVLREAMQTTVEELKSSNEELQSTNEELQSTNEELTTSKEELQSLNEELQTVNAELRSKVDDLTGVRNDMSNLLNSTEIATVFLDAELRLRRFTPYATKLFKLIPGDVGRHLSDVNTELSYPALWADAHEVLQTLVFRQSLVSTQAGGWYRVRIMPYRTQENVIDGVVITFTDVSEVIALERQLKHHQSS